MDVNAFGWSVNDTITAFLTFCVAGSFTGLMLWFIRFMLFTFFEFPKGKQNYKQL